MPAGAGDLVGQANELAQALTRTVRVAVSDDALISAAAVEGDDGGPVFYLGNHLDTSGELSVATLRGEPIVVPDDDRIALYANWTFIPSSSSEWLKTYKSSFKLMVRSGQDAEYSPIFRLEVDPKWGGHDRWLAAHIQVTAESRLLGFLQGIRGTEAKRLQQYHLPVGGFRYRPCFEDFLEFAIDERLIPDRPGAVDALDATRDEYRRRQFQSLVLKWPEVAIESLKAAGHLAY